MRSAHVIAVLLAEDDDNDYFFLKRAFLRAKISGSLHRVQDGEEAIAYLKGDGAHADRELHPVPDLLLLDLKMPRKNGFEVMEWVRQQEGLKRLPIVVLSSSKEDPDVNRAYELGANSYLVKPLNHEALVEMMDALNRFWLVLAQKPSLLP